MGPEELFAASQQRKVHQLFLSNLYKNDVSGNSQRCLGSGMKTEHCWSSNPTTSVISCTMMFTYTYELRIGVDKKCKKVEIGLKNDQHLAICEGWASQSNLRPSRFVQANNPASYSSQKQLDPTQRDFNSFSSCRLVYIRKLHCTL